MNQPKESKELLSELMRPQQLDELMLPQPDMDNLSRMAQSGSIMNMLFWGQPGTGKTSAARILMKLAGEDNSMELSGSSALSKGNFVRNIVADYASSVSFLHVPKICFVDEAEFVPKNAQLEVLKVIEDFSENCRFILAVNNKPNLVAPLRSRLRPICFDVGASDRDEVIRRLLQRYELKLSEIGATLEQRRLREIIGIHFPDLRAIANNVQYELG